MNAQLAGSGSDYLWPPARVGQTIFGSLIAAITWTIGIALLSASTPFAVAQEVSDARVKATESSFEAIGISPLPCPFTAAPIEAEFEFAARGGLSGKAYAWGDEFRPNGKWMANTWQGKFPVKDTGQDGFAGIAPVESLPPNGYGLYDMAGNVWEWCSDWYRPDYYEQLTKTGRLATNPQGPDAPFDPGEPNEKKRVQRAGSFLCNDQYCSRYLVGTRGKGEVNTGTNHLGFRCVRSRDQQLQANTGPTRN